MGPGIKRYRSSDHVDVFSIERGRKRTYKGFQYFCQGHDREGGNLVEHTFSCLTDILFRTSHWTISNYSLLNTRLIEAEYSRRGYIENQIGNNSLMGYMESPEV